MNKYSPSSAPTTYAAPFKAGDSVLCPTLGNGSYQLFNDKEYDCLGFTANGNIYHYRNDGKVSKHDKAPSLFHDTPANRQALYAPLFAAGDVILCPAVGNLVYELSSTGGELLAFSDDTRTYYCHADGRFNPSDALPSVFHDSRENGNAIITLYGDIDEPCIQTSQRTIINHTATDDDEVILLPSIMLSDIACDIDKAADILNDVSDLLRLIYSGEINHATAKALARLAHDSTSTWAELLSSQLADINEPLEQSKFGKVEA